MIQLCLRSSTGRMLSLITLCLAFVGLGHSAVVVPAVAPCCQPLQMEGMITVLTSMTTLMFYNDYTLNKTLSVSLEGLDKGWILDDLNVGKRYESDGANCVAMPYPVPAEARARCIPSSATYLGAGSFGPIGVLPYRSYQWKVGDITETIALSVTGCVPIVQKLQSAAIGDFIEMFENIKTTISDPTVFNVDTSKCVETTVVG